MVVAGNFCPFQSAKYYVQTMQLVSVSNTILTIKSAAFPDKLTNRLKSLQKLIPTGISIKHFVCGAVLASLRLILVFLLILFSIYDWKIRLVFEEW